MLKDRIKKDSFSSESYRENMKKLIKLSAIITHNVIYIYVYSFPLFLINIIIVVVVVVVVVNNL